MLPEKTARRLCRKTAVSGRRPKPADFPIGLIFTGCTDGLWNTCRRWRQKLSTTYDSFNFVLIFPIKNAKKFVYGKIKKRRIQDGFSG
ncbi:hypothetical protein HMPREF1548_05118 [Clostridium sp. KLE 1755]|nr:hypothetical protein HMPREF1548_05118 [Clostridium sp. KLE 1755]